MTRTLSRSLAVALVALALTTSVAALVLAGVNEALGVDDVLAVVGAVATACVGALVVAARTLEAFGSRLREQTALDTLQHDLRAVVHQTVQPSHLSLWLKGEAES